MAQSDNTKTNKRVRAMKFSSVYPLYIRKVEKKARTKSEVDQVIRWLTGYSQKEIDSQLKKQVTFEDFFVQAPNMNPLRSFITGTICGVRLEDINDPFMKNVRYLDKLVDEIAKGASMEKILRVDKTLVE